MDGRREEIKAILREFLGSTNLDAPEQRSRARESEWLRILHDSKLEQHLADQGRIWVTAAIFLPLALAPFTVFAFKGTVTLPQVFLASFASLMLLGSWHVLATRMQWHADRNLDWVRSIRREVGIGSTSYTHSPLSQRRLRSLLLTFVAAAWVVVSILVGTDRL